MQSLSYFAIQNIPFIALLSLFHRSYIALLSFLAELRRQLSTKGDEEKNIEEDVKEDQRTKQELIHSLENKLKISQSENETLLLKSK